MIEEYGISAVLLLILTLFTQAIACRFNWAVRCKGVMLASVSFCLQGKSRRSFDSYLPAKEEDANEICLAANLNKELRIRNIGSRRQLTWQ